MKSALVSIAIRVASGAMRSQHMLGEGADARAIFDEQLAIRPVDRREHLVDRRLRGRDDRADHHRVLDEALAGSARAGRRPPRARSGALLRASSQDADMPDSRLLRKGAALADRGALGKAHARLRPIVRRYERGRFTSGKAA